jgi:AcrR family transcriptional regulator
MIVSKKQRNILDAGDKLFMKFGIRKVTIEDVCTEANVSKMTFYKYFDNKNHLVKTMLTEMISTNTKKYEEIMADDTIFGEKIKLMIEMKLSMINDFSMDFLKDIYSDAELFGFLNNYSNEFYLRIRKDFIEAQNRNELSKDVNIEIAFYLMFKLQDVFKDEIMLSQFDSATVILDEWMKILLYGIIKR